MQIRMLLVLLANSIVLSCASQVHAHHGMDAYDTRVPLELRGKVVAFELMDPHSLLYVDVENQDGTVTSWVIEGGAAHGIVRAGISEASLALGPGVLVRGYQSKDGQCAPNCKAVGRDFVFD